MNKLIIASLIAVSSLFIINPIHSSACVTEQTDNYYIESGDHRATISSYNAKTKVLILKTDCNQLYSFKFDISSKQLAIYKKCDFFFHFSDLKETKLEWFTIESINANGNPILLFDL